MYSNQDPEEQFELLEVIGEGAYATVYKGKHKNGQIVAIKIVPSTGEIQSLVKEIQILKECQNPHIVKYFGSFYKEGNLWLVMEFCVGGSVIDLMRITKRSLTEKEIAAILYQVLHGLDYLHQNKKIHRDIKAGNILLDIHGQVKLADFGVAAQLTFTNADKGTVIGTPFWMSPEVISKNRYNNLTDIWSLGVTAIELAEGTPPYSHIHPVRAMFAIKNNPPQGLTNPEKWSKEFNDFVRACLKVQVSERPSAQQLLMMPFIKMGQLEQKRLINLIEVSINQIENYRQKYVQVQPKGGDDKIITIISQQSIASDDQDQQSVGTVVECGTLVIKDEIQVPKENELDFVAYAKQQKQIDQMIDEQLSEEQQIENMTQEERKKFLQYLSQQMEEDIKKVKQKYQPKMELIKQKIKENEKSPQKIEVNLPFTFQVNQELLQKLSNIKIPQIKLQTAQSPTSQLRSNPKQRPPFEFIPKQNYNGHY